MANNGFEVNIEQLTYDSGKILGILEDIGKCGKNLEEQVAVLESAWDGQAGRNFCNRLRQDLKTCESLRKELKQSAQEMETSAKQYGFCDELVREIVESVKI